MGNQPSSPSDAPADAFLMSKALTERAGANQPLILRWWRNPNVRFILVAVASAASFRWALAWPRGGSVYIGKTPGALLWAVAYLLFPSFLTIFFGAWGLKILFQVLLRSGPAGGYLSTQVAATAAQRGINGSQTDSRRANRLTAGFLVAIALLILCNWGLRKVAHWGPKTLATSTAGWVLLTVLTVAFFAYAIRKRPPAKPSARAIPSNIIVLIGSILIVAGSWALPGSKRGLTLALLGVVILQVLVWIPIALVRWTWEAAHRAQYRVALHRAKLCSWFPSYPRALEGEILYNAGRYSEAKALLRRYAFAANGSPRLTNAALCVYAQVAAAEGNIQESEQLLETALRVPQKIGAFQMALAVLLLSSKKEPERALRLIEEVVQAWSPVGPPSFQAWLLAHRSAAHGWALALAGRRTEAQQDLQQAFANLLPGARRDIACVKLLAGETYLALGDLDAARKAFAEAAEHDPEGHHGRKALTRLETISR
jgi:hypothetical protein